MKKIVPFKKDIVFNANIGEINSISLEHFISEKDNNEIKGHFIISGEYKVTETSMNVDFFEHKLPFNISIDNRYDTSNMEIDIDNFYYEVMNNKVLQINIDLAIDNLEEIEKLMEIKEEEEILPEVKEVKKEGSRCIEIEEKDDKEYRTYKVYIIKENDTVEGILEKNNITREKLDMYNDLNNLQLGDKLIIPSV